MVRGAGMTVILTVHVLGVLRIEAVRRKEPAVSWCTALHWPATALLRIGWPLPSLPWPPSEGDR
jgi:hypothetical protein